MQRPDTPAASSWSAMELEEHLEQLVESRDHLRGECPMCAEISRRLHFAGPPQARIETSLPAPTLEDLHGEG